MDIVCQVNEIRKRKAVPVTFLEVPCFTYRLKRLAAKVTEMLLTFSENSTTNRINSQTFLQMGGPSA